MSFWNRVRKASPGECWPWVGGHNPQGYGITKFGGRLMNAPRASWFLANGPIPDGLYVLHSCDNPPCVNPAHLTVGSQADNVLDMNRKGRHGRGYRVQGGENHAAARLSDEQVAAVRVLRAAGWTQRRIGKLLGLSHTYVGMLERGEKRAG